MQARYAIWNVWVVPILHFAYLWSAQVTWSCGVDGRNCPVTSLRCVCCPLLSQEVAGFIELRGWGDRVCYTLNSWRWNNRSETDTDKNFAWEALCFPHISWLKHISSLDPWGILMQVQCLAVAYLSSVTCCIARVMFFSDDSVRGLHHRPCASQWC